MKTRVSAVFLTLAGCTALPPSDNQTIEQFVSALSGKGLRLQHPMAADASGASTQSGAKDAEFGYAGLRQVYAPAYKHCESGGGILRIAERRAFSRGGATLPARFQCRCGEKLLWELGAHYAERLVSTDKGVRTVALTPQVNLFTATATATAIASRHTNRDSVSRAEPRPQDEEKAATHADPANRPAAGQNQSTQSTQKTAKGDALALFRKNLKPGDRVQWKTAAMPAKGVGQVIRLNGDLALVQFDAQALAGQTLRYFNRSQLEPFDGIMPAHATR